MSWELDWLEHRARLSSKKEAIIDESTNKAWTFGELNDRAASAASWLQTQGVRKGDRIALLSPNHISYFDLLFACGKIGAIFVPLNWRLSIQEIKEIIADCTPVILGVHLQFEELFEELKAAGITYFNVGDIKYEKEVISLNHHGFSAEINETDPLLMIYTGGTTGKPKGVVLSHQSVFWNALNTITSWSLSKDDVTVNYMPMFHTGGLNALSIPILMMGGTVVIGESFTGKKAVDSLNRYHCTIILLVPTMYHLLIQTKEFQKSSFPSMKIFLSGAAPCPLPIYEAFQKKGLAFKEGYGLTEAGPNNFYISPKEAAEKRGSVGKPMLFNSIKLLKEDGSETGPNEVGELLIKGKHGFSFYWNREQETRKTVKNGWIHTGDLAKKDEEGFYYIVGRKKDMIITGGENVYPLEIEHWISSHPYVDSAAVIGLPDEKWGEMVTAFIVLKHTSSVSEEELKEYCSRKLGRYKVPKRFFFVKELPKTHVGKIDKKKLKELSDQIK
ncbi:long-chain fatty acid--CoA ligase [Neobacillus mesonae]|uniref:acyl-CoA synthetase n=1 Tax=Neobacillus mesonae TaxID=1193713 RepID=UPI0020419B7A|nr:long-chain fatty acid--CoA ligase [Neobacillus mesonae]MCM3568277.1 long-chain fatty acid--CoA ligase [Neobacillus mesonae]